MKCEKYIQRLPAVQSPKSNTEKKCMVTHAKIFHFWNMKRYNAFYISQLLYIAKRKCHTYISQILQANNGPHFFLLSSNHAMLQSSDWKEQGALKQFEQINLDKQDILK